MSVPEKTILLDKETGKTIWRITNSNKEDIHTYYDRCPWSQNGKYILFSSANTQNLSLQGNILATQKGEVYLIDMKTYKRIRIAENAFFHSHQGAETIWNFKKNKVYFRQGGEKVGVVNVATKEVEQFQEGRYYRFFGLSSDGKKFVFENIDKSQLEGKGIYTMNEDCSDITMIASTEESFEISPYKEKFKANDAIVSLAKWSPNNKYVLFNMWILDTTQPKIRVSSDVQTGLFIASKDGNEKWWLGYTGHHQSFTPDSKRVIWGDWKYTDPQDQANNSKSQAGKKEPRIVMINIDGSDRHFAVDEPVAQHPTMDPTGKFIVTFDKEGVILVNVAKQLVERPVFFNPKFDQSHAGTHPHCVWNHDGTQILYNSAETGNSQLYIIPLK